MPIRVNRLVVDADITLIVGPVLPHEVIGFSDKRASQAELVLVEAGNLTRKPEKVSWEAAGGLYVAGTTAWGAVRAVQPDQGETVVISGAAGGGSARSPSSSRGVPGPRSSAWRARATTSG